MRGRQMALDDRADRAAPMLWVALLTAASLATTLVFACATPFPSLAALAAVHMRRHDGLSLMVAAWVVSQATGFCIMGYPWDGATALTGFAVGTAGVAAMLAASVADSRVAAPGTAVRLVIAYLAAFVAFKAVIAAWSPVMGHADAALSMTVMLRQFVRYAAVLAGLYALYRALIAAGAPAPMAHPLAARPC